MVSGEIQDSSVQRPAIGVAVRELCEFCAKRGDLDRRFTPAPTAQQGIAGHGTVAGRRATGYERELPLEGRYLELTVRGRADGYDPVRRRLEEVKTHRGDSAGIPANHRALHWAQLKVYGALICRARGYREIELALVYFRIDDETETVLAETFPAEALECYFEQQAALYLDWARQEQAHRLRRNRGIEAFAFPHGAFNPGQRALAEAVYRAATQKASMLAQAPTGIGKTVGTLFPALKACTRQAIDKLYFLTAKSPGRQVALDTLALIQGEDRAPPLRVLELASREKSCVHPDRECHGASCPLAEGFYDRLPAARAAAVQASPLDQPRLREVAAEHRVCPYYLGQELIRWSDVIVGDYNYYFDAHAVLHGLMAINDWRVTVLVDEAHNLVERARDMYSAALAQKPLQRARKAAPPVLRTALGRVQRRWTALLAGQGEAYRVLEQLPEDVLAALSDFIAAASALSAETGTGFEPDLQQFFFDAIRFVRTADAFGAHSMIDLARDETGTQSDRANATLCIRNIVPAPFLGPRFEAAHGAVLFSATLNPPAYYRDLLGLAPEAPWLDVPSPFSAAQLTVKLARHVSTRFPDRDASLRPIVELISSEYRARPGNYLAFFSSFDYLEQAIATLHRVHPDLPVWAQARRMDEAARTTFLQRFTSEGRGIGFAVLGGVFSEGIDLPGDRLVGAFVVTLGIPQVNPVNEEMRRRMATLFGSGYEYAYLYPGLRKVVQAAGRVIRSREDRGTVVLVDRRYARPGVQALLPAWWTIEG